MQYLRPHLILEMFRSKARKRLKHYVYCADFQWAGQRSRYSDWLRARRSGDRIPVKARFSAPAQPDAGAHPASCTMGIGSFPGVKSGWGVTLTPQPLLVPWSWKGRVIPTPPICRTACTEPQCLYKSALNLLLYSYSDLTVSGVKEVLFQ
jgi:hypothetical protein